MTSTTRFLTVAEEGQRLPSRYHLQIWLKLVIGLGTLAALTVLVVLISILEGTAAGQSIRSTADAHMPAALASSRAQADVLRMSGDLQSYLVQGQPAARAGYTSSAAAVTADLVTLDSLSGSLSAADQQHVADLKAAFARWTPLPDRLFALHDDPLAREPALKLLSTESLPLANTVVTDSNTMVDSLARQGPAGSTAPLAGLARFQSSFAAALYSLRAYVANRGPNFQDEFQANLAANDTAWEALNGERAALVPGDQAVLAKLGNDRAAFLASADNVLGLMAGDQWRQDLYAYRTEAAPLAEQMLALLGQIAADQQGAAQSDLNLGGVQLSGERLVALVAGLLAVLFASGMFLFLRGTIGGPIRRLTQVAEQVRGGDLAAQAHIESKDEIGTLAESFNRMTRYLRRTLFQTRREKKRADDLLNVVIPLGLQLSAEKDFSRMLETIVIQAQTFCRANCGVLYLRNDAGHLQPIVLRDGAAGLALGGTTGEPVPYEPLPLDDPMFSLAVRAAWFGTTVNVPDAVPSGALNYVSPAYVDNPYENNTSFLAIPLKPSQGQVMGVLQLTGAQDPDSRQVVPFDSHLQQMMDSFSLLAAGALEGYLREQGLKQQIKQLRIEIDEVKRQQQVKEIVDSDFFQNLQAKVRSARERNARPEQQAPDAGAGTKNAQPGESPLSE
jgi:HAMP domain-containing protein